MSTPFIIVICGLPASGKSTLARQLRGCLRWPLLAKDDYKESLFDSLGVRDAEWSRSLSRAAYRILFANAHELANAGMNFMIEGNFRWQEWGSELTGLSSNGAQVVQIHCRATPEELVARFQERSAHRHVGHADAQNFASIESELLTASQLPLPLDGNLFDCDTSGDWQSAIQDCVQRVIAHVRAANT